MSLVTFRTTLFGGSGCLPAWHDFLE